MPVECLYRALVVDELAVVSTLSLFRVVPPHPHLVPPSFVHSPLVINPPVAHHCCRSVSAAPPGLLAYRRCRPAPSSSFGVFRPLPVPWLAWCARPWYVPVLLPNSPVGTRCADHTQAWVAGDARAPTCLPRAPTAGVAFPCPLGNGGLQSLGMHLLDYGRI